MSSRVVGVTLVAAAGLMLAWAGAVTRAQDSVRRDAVTLDPITAIVNPFKVPRFRLKTGISQMTSPADTTLIPPEEWRPFPMQDQFDALLYLGDPSTITTSQVSPTSCTDRAYLDQRLHRMALGGSAQNEIDRLKAYCSSVAPN